MENHDVKRVFTNLIRLSGQREDFFTECLAMTLNSDAQLLRDLTGRLLENLGPLALSSESVVRISTQRSFAGTHGCVIDMVIEVAGGPTIGVENKLYASEGEDQLLRYTGLPIDHLAFITGSPGYAVAEPVLRNPKYLRPSNRREHFIWHDFFKCVDDAARRALSPLTQALRELFILYGFTPPQPGIKDLNDPDPLKNRSNRENMAKLWDRTRTAFIDRGWKTEAGSIAELYLKNGPDERVEWIWLNPADRQGALRMRITPGRATRVEDMARVLEEHRDNVHHDLLLEPRVASRHEGKREVLDVLVSFDRLLGDIEDPEQIGRRLAAFTTSVYDTILGHLKKNKNMENRVRAMAFDIEINTRGR